MLRNYVVIAVRNLMRYRLYAASTSSGSGWPLCLLAWRFASQEWSLDRFHAKAGRIYRVVSLLGDPKGGRCTPNTAAESLWCE